MAKSSEQTSTRYRIGAVSRLTGISPDALRVWERRYGAVSPQRSPAGGRLYGTADVDRLRLIKQLVDSGDAIGEIANLDTASLQQRIEASQRIPVQHGETLEIPPCRVVLVGRSLLPMAESASEAAGKITVVAGFDDIEKFKAGAGEVTADVLVLEQVTLHADTAASVIDWLACARARHAIIVYRFASSEALQRLPASMCTALRAPLDPETLQSHCRSVLLSTAALSAPQPGASTEMPLAPARRYDDETLAQLAAISTTVQCECPRHLAELLSTLAGFERYSAECESRSPDDAALHAYLHSTASRARHMIEDALDHVIEVEDIKL